MKSKYTFEYHNEIEELLDTSLAEIAKTVESQKDGVCKNLAYLVLGGGYGRGEGGILNQDGKVSLFNDLDFFVISKNQDSKENAKMDIFFKSLGQDWSQRLKIDVDFCAAKSVDYIAKRTNILMWREMVLGANIVVGRAEEFKKSFQIKGEIPVTEIEKLLYNRFSGLLFARFTMQNKTNLSFDDCDFISRNINKAILACADAIFASKGIYDFSVLNKLSRISELELPESLESLRQMYVTAVDFKKKPNPLTDKEVLQERLTQTTLLAIKVLESLEKYFAKIESAGVFKRLVWIKYNLRARKYFEIFGIGNKLFVNPISKGLRIFKTLIFTNKIDEKKMSAYKDIWRRIN